jgi:glucokinase
MFFLVFLFLCIITDNYALTPKIKQHVENMPENPTCILGADIGGTKSNVAIFEVKDEKPILLISAHAETKEIGDFNEVMNNFLYYIADQYGISIEHACIAAPGVATKNKDFSNVHGMFEIKTSELLEKTPLKTAIIVNDLFVVGHGLDSIAPENIIHLYGDIPTEPNKEDIRAIISAGTGIGSSIITWDSEKKRYITHPGEAGMLEFTPTNKLEYLLANHVKNFYNRDTMYWANVASGSGITRVYSMLKLMDKHIDTLKLDKHAAQVIIDHPEDELCKATTDLVFKLFGRFTRNYVWTTLPYGGLYIVGSMAAKNPDLFSEKFAQHYENPEFHKQLKQIPIYLVKDTNIGLYGAANYLLLTMQDQAAEKSVKN